MQDQLAFRARAWQRLSAYDKAVLMSVRRLQLPALTQLMRTATHAGDAASWTLVTLGLAAAGGKYVRQAKLVGGATLLATLISQLLKRKLRRPRPSAAVEGFVALMENPDAFSFPSGHSAAAFAAASSLVGVTPAAPLVLSLAGTIALARIYLGAHYPLDVAVGIVIGLLSGAVTHAAVGR